MNRDSAANGLTNVVVPNTGSEHWDASQTTTATTTAKESLFVSAITISEWI